MHKFSVKTLLLKHPMETYTLKYDQVLPDQEKSPFRWGTQTLLK